MAYLNEIGMPMPSYDRDKKRMADYLNRTYQEMLDYLLLQMSFAPDETKIIRQTEIMRQINFMLKELDAQMAKEIEQLITKVFKDGQGYTLLSVKDATTWSEALEATSWNNLDRRKVEALLADTYGDILLATDNTFHAIKQVVRETTAIVARYHALRDGSYFEQAEKLYKELTRQGLSKKIIKDGFVGIIDRAGRRWDLSTYCKMVIKTKINDAFTEGQLHEMEQLDLDLAVISSHGATDDCAKWEGVVLSMRGLTPGFPTYEEARATNEVFHPNCEHRIHPIRSLALLHADDRAKVKTQMAQLGDWKARKYVRKSKK